MNSNRDDAPDYLRNNKQSPLRLVGMLGIGFAITWGLIAFFDKPDVIGVNQPKQLTQSYSEPVQATEESPDFAPQIAQWPISREEVEWLEANKDSIVQEAQDAYNEDDYEHAAPAIR